MRSLVPLAIGVLVLVALVGFFGIRDLRRRSAARMGRLVGRPARFAIGDEPARRGKLDVAPLTLRWSSDDDTGVELRRAQALTAIGAGHAGRIELQLALADGRTGRLVVDKRDAKVLTTALAGGRTPLAAAPDVQPVEGETAAAYLARLAPLAAQRTRRSTWLSSDAPGGAPIRASQRTIGESLSTPIFVLFLVLRLTVVEELDYWPAALVGTAVVLLWVALRMLKLGRTYRTIRDLATQAGRPASGVVASDNDGQPVLLIADPVLTPPVLYAVTLRTPLPAAALNTDRPLTLIAHGTLADGALLAFELPEGALVPAKPATQVDAELLLGLLDPVGILREFYPPN